MSIFHNFVRTSFMDSSNWI